MKDGKKSSKTIEETDALKVWGGWNEQPPQGPDNDLLVEFARTKRGVIIYDSLVEFHTGDEQSSTETRRFMRKFRRLAHCGATVIVLHHTGKSAGAQQYRGSSDIKAAVDTAYSLKKVSEKGGKLYQLHLESFKSRLAPGNSFDLEFIPGVGFASCQIPLEDRIGPEDILLEIIAENPDITGTKLEEIARERGLGKGTIGTLLKNEAKKLNGLWERHRGDGNTYHYSVREDTVDAA